LIGKSKRDFEMVIARYDEDISWSDNYKAFRTIYNKGPDISGCEYIQLENVGHLADTILRHILRNYENLAEVTFFTHGSFNYRKNQRIYEREDRTPCDAFFEDFIQLGDNFLKCIRCYNLPGANERINMYPETVGAVFEYLFEKPYLANFPWADGKWISISKKFILSRPKEFYQKMLDWVLQPCNGDQTIYRIRGIYIERFILYAFVGI
jgi:hypothetical protein